MSIVNFWNDPSIINRFKTDNLSFIRSNYTYVNQEVEAFNSALPDFVTTVFTARKQRIKTNADFAAAMGVKIRVKKEDPPITKEKDIQASEISNINRR